MAAKKTKIKKQETVKIATKPKVVGLSAPLISARGKSTTTLSEAVFGQKPNKVLLAQAIRVVLSNKRTAHAKTKSRGEVNRTTKKIYRQKGTGGARHGSRSAPIYVGGGIAHGPDGLQNYHLKLPTKMRRQALISALSSRVQEGSLIVADIETAQKTKEVAKVLQENGNSTLVYKSNVLYRAARNLKDVNLVAANQLTAYDALVGKYLVITREAIKDLEERLAK